MGSGCLRKGPTWIDKIHREFRRFYAKHYIDILDEIFLFTVGLLFLALLLPVITFLESLF
ncbi:MAG: hypothetical protein LHV69_09840 [Elusimicrobia bacterium]|nr:hypothetical protein [Candidatus Obscuribacterium magneticum]